MANGLLQGFTNVLGQNTQGVPELLLQLQRLQQSQAQHAEQVGLRKEQLEETKRLHRATQSMTEEARQQGRARLEFEGAAHGVSPEIRKKLGLPGIIPVPETPPDMLSIFSELVSGNVQTTEDARKVLGSLPFDKQLQVFQAAQKFTQDAEKRREQSELIQTLPPEQQTRAKMSILGMHPNDIFREPSSKHLTDHDHIFRMVNGKNPDGTPATSAQVAESTQFVKTLDKRKSDELIVKEKLQQELATFRDKLSTQRKDVGDRNRSISNHFNAIGKQALAVETRLKTVEAFLAEQLAHPEWYTENIGGLGFQNLQAMLQLGGANVAAAQDAQTMLVSVNEARGMGDVGRIALQELTAVSQSIPSPLKDVRGRMIEKVGVTRARIADVRKRIGDAARKEADAAREAGVPERLIRAMAGGQFDLFRHVEEEPPSAGEFRILKRGR